MTDGKQSLSASHKDKINAARDHLRHITLKKIMAYRLCQIALN
jgi:hypothetical protein